MAQAIVDVGYRHVPSGMADGQGTATLVLSTHSLPHLGRLAQGMGWVHAVDQRHFTAFIGTVERDGDTVYLTIPLHTEARFVNDFGFVILDWMRSTPLDA